MPGLPIVFFILAAVAVGTALGMLHQPQRDLFGPVPGA